MYLTPEARRMLLEEAEKFITREILAADKTSPNIGNLLRDRQNIRQFLKQFHSIDYAVDDDQLAA